MYVCLCKGITEKQIRQEVHNGSVSFAQIQEKLGIATHCGTCRETAITLVDETLQKNQVDQSDNVISLWSPATKAVKR